MKKLKKLLSIVLAVAMVMSLAVSVGANNGTLTETSDSTSTDTTTGTYTITISNSTKGYEYAAYQIFAGDLYVDSDGTITLSNITWGSGVNTTKQVSEKTLIGAIKEMAIGNNTPFSTCTDAASVAKVLSGATKDSEIAEEFAEVVGKYLADTATKTSQEKSSEDGYEISGLSAGYYLVKTTSVPSGATDTAYTAYILEVVNDVTVSEKTSVPSLAKTVDDVNDSTGKTATGSSADYDIGDSVPFTLTATLGDSYYEKYDTYSLTFHDTLSSGLSFNNDVTVTVYTAYTYTTLGGTWESSTDYYTYDSETGEFTKVDKENTNTPANNGTPYYTAGVKATDGYEVQIKNDKTNSTDDCSFEVVIADTRSLEDTDGTAISVTSGSVITVDYTAKLETGASYKEDNTAYLEYSNNPNGDGTGTTTTDLTTVFTYTLTVNKTDSSENPLKGAGFTLYKYDGNSYVEVGDEVKGDDMTSFVWKGLDDGQYKLVETTTPDGYNTMKDVEFYIIAEHSENEITSLKVTSDADGTEEIADWTEETSDGTITVSIKNEKGSNLPETGGIGVTVFYVVGGILILAAAGVIVISRKKIKK